MEERIEGAGTDPAPHPFAFGPLLTRSELAERAGTSVALLDALERDGLLIPHATDDQARYGADDAETLSAALTLLDAGVPLDELLHLARRHDAALRASADHAVDLFVRFVVDPIRVAAASQEEADERLSAAVETMLPATNKLVAKHFERLLVARAFDRFDDD